MADTVNCNVKAEGGFVWFDEEKAAKDCAATLGTGYKVVEQGDGSDESRYGNYRMDHYIVTGSTPTLASVESGNKATDKAPAGTNWYQYVGFFSGAK